jgi:hypothetical protein
LDIDIDLPTNFDPKKIFTSVRVASMLKGSEFVKHPCGAYFQGIAVDPITGLAAIPHKEAQDLGFFKIDFLHLSVLDDFTTKEQIRKLMKYKPDWTLLNSQEVVEKLFHIKNHFDLVNRVKPTSVQELADIMALIRPGRRQLVDQYMMNKEAVRKKQLYERQAHDEYSFKRSHAIAYAYNVVLQLHLIKKGLL